ncbi:MAG: hypothetical protein Q7U47_14775 [Paludibacter sp.]|nr:hypothetical protein [Paludibacter sp.]
MKKFIIIFILFLVISCSDSERFVQFGLRNSTDKNIVVEYKQSDNKKIVYTIFPSNFALIYATSLTDEMTENDVFNFFLSKIDVFTTDVNSTFFIEKDSLSNLSRWGKNVSYDMGDEYILYIKGIKSDMFKKN